MKTFAANAKACRGNPDNNQTPCSSKTKNTHSKVKHLSNVEVSEFMLEKNITDDSQLLAIAKERHESGEKDLYRFVVNKPPKAISDLVKTTWRIQSAPDVVLRERTPRIDTIKALLSGECAPECEGEWLKPAKEVIKQNGFNVYVIAAAIRDAIIKGRQKNNNIMLVGPTNCGKLFLLNPLEIIFKSFMNPANGKYAWVGLDECEIAYLNDFRWSQEIIAWNDFLLLLEGQTVHLPRPKNMFATDLCISRENRLPIFSTGKAPIEYIGKYNCRDERESDMMATRWKVFTFHHQIPVSEAKQIPPCPHCFCKLVMTGSEEDCKKL